MMDKNDHLDHRIARWLEEEAPARLPDRVLRRTLDRTRQTRQRVGWQALLARLQLTRLAIALSGAAVAVVVAAIALGVYSQRPGFGGPAVPVTPTPTLAAESKTPAPSNTPAPSVDQPPAFVGNWQATDSPGDSSHLTMTIVDLSDGTYELTSLDDGASVCRGAPSTMTALATVSQQGTLVIEQVVFTCDDGSSPEALSGPPLEEQLSNLSFTYDPRRDQLQDSFGLVWQRPAAQPNTPVPPGAFVGNWQATDGPPDSSQLTMSVVDLADGTYELTILDDFASVCRGAPSTMTGVAEADGLATIVIAQPQYTCDDGSRPRALSGPPLHEQLRNLSFTYEARRDTLLDSHGLNWTRLEVTP